MKFKCFLMILLILCLCGTAYSADVNINETYSTQDGDLAVNQGVFDAMASAGESSHLKESSSDNNLSVISENEPLGGGIVYFDASISDRDDRRADGSIKKPFKYLYDGRVSGKTAYLAKGSYQFLSNDIWGKMFKLASFENTIIIGEDLENTFVYSDDYQVEFSGENIISNVCVLNLNAVASGSYVSNSKLTFNNIAVNSALSLMGNSFIFMNSKFVNCQGFFDGTNSYGGVIYSVYDREYGMNNIYLKNCSFINNTAEYGGVVYMDGGTLTVDNCSFINNTAQCFGGALTCENVEHLNIVNTTFKDNNALNSAGGALYIVNSYLNIENTNFTNCISLFGGAVSSLNSTLIVSKSNLKNNKAIYYGGAIYVMYGQAVIDEDNEFIENSALYGGALLIDQSDYCHVISTFINNSATMGGAIYSFKNDADFNYNIFEGNVALMGNNTYEINNLNLTLFDDDSLVFKYNPVNYDNLPDRYNLVEEGFVSPVKDQISDGNCWAFSACSVLESCILKATNGSALYDFSEENIKNLMAIFSDYGWTFLTNDGGNPVMTWGYLADWLGPVFEADDPYFANTLLSPLLKSVFHVQNIIFLKRDNFTDNDMIKDAILKYGAVGTEMYYDDIYLKKVSYYCNRNEEAPNHEVTIVGWDDHYLAKNFKNNPGADGAWIVKNSWGQEWGSDGYFYVSYYDKMFAPPGVVDVTYTILLNDSIAYDKNYQYDLGVESYWDITGTDKVTYFNIFNIESDEYLAGVSTYFNDTYNYKLEISINGVLNCTENGIMNPGYYTIPLNSFISLSQGDKLKVSFTLTSINGGVAAFPYSEGCYVKNPVLIEGTSFVDWYGKDLDLVKKYGLVACIKAFTITKLPVNLSVPNMEFTYGGFDCIEVTTEASNITAKVINHTEANVEVNGKFITVSGLDAGNYLLSVTANDETYKTKTVTSIITVNKANSTLDDLNPFDFVYGSYADINVNYDGASNVTAFVAGHKEANVVVGNKSIKISNLAAGNYTLNVTTVVDNNHNDISKTVEFIVNKAVPVLTVEDISAIGYGDESITIIANYNGDYTVVVDSPITVTGVVAGVPKTVNVGKLNAGDYTVKVKFNGDANYTESNVVNKDFTVVKANVTINIVADDVTYPNDVVLTVESDVAGNYSLFVGTSSPKYIVLDAGVARDVSFEGLDAGTYEFSVALPESVNYNAVKKSVNVTIVKADVDLSITAGNVTYPDDVVLTLLSDVSGNYSLYLGTASPINIVLEAGVAKKLECAEYDAGTHEFTIAYLGSNNYNAARDSINVTVAKANVNMTIASSDVTYPDDVVLTLLSDVSGNYNLFKGITSPKYINLEAGVSKEVKFTDLDADTYEFALVYLETDNYNTGRTAINVTVNKVENTNISVEVTTPVAGENATVTVTLPADATGNVSVKYDNGVYFAEVINGTAVVSVPTAAVGTETASVTYSGDNNYGSVSSEVNITVKVQGVIIAENITRGINSPYDYCAKLVNAEGQPIGDVEITFTIEGEIYKAKTNSSGIAAVRAGLAVKDTAYDVTVTNPYTLENTTATTTIVPRLIVISDDLTADYLENPPYVVQAIGDDGNPVGAGEIVEIAFAKKTYNITTNATGHAVRTIGLAPGQYGVYARYQGDRTNQTVFIVKQVLKATSGTLKKTAKKYTLKATLKHTNGKAISGKVVKLTFNGKTYSVKTNSKGVASVVIKSSVIKKLKAGKTYVLKARYVNDVVKGKIKIFKK